MILFFCGRCESHEVVEADRCNHALSRRHRLGRFRVGEGVEDIERG